VNKIKLKLGYSTIALFIMLTGCSHGVSYVSHYGIAYNTEREKRGIPTIPVSWKIDDIGSFFDCYDSKPDLSKPYRLSKRVCINDNGIIDKEVDHFYSGKSFVFDQAKLSQEVEITYDYSKEANGNPWQALASLGPHQVSEQISIQEADRLLGAWGLTRTNLN
jgi:hypothetical protein